MICYNNNGQSMRAVDANYQPTVGEVVFDHYASDAELDAAFPSRPATRLSDLRDVRLLDINSKAAAALAAISASYPEGEVQSWPQQTREAETLAADQNAQAPMLTAIATARGLTVAELADRVRAKVAAYTVASGSIIGRRQALEDRLLAISLQEHDAAEQLAAITWPEA